MVNQTIAPDGPFKLKMEVKLVAVSGEFEGYEAWAEIELAPGQVPTADYIKERINAAHDQLGKDFELVGRHDFVCGLLNEKSGTNLKFSVDGPDSFTLIPREVNND